MSCYASILAPARGSGLALRPAHRGSGSVLPVPTARIHLPRWTGGAPSPKLQASAGKKVCCTKPGGSSFPGPEWVDFTKPAPAGGSSFPGAEWVDFTKPAPASSEPSGWIEPWDHTQVTAHEIMLWCITDAQDLIRKTPPPPLPGFDLDKLLAEYETLSKCAESESIEIFAGTDLFLKLQVKTWQNYGEIVKGFRGGREDVVDVARTVSAACVDHVIRHRLLFRFGIKMDNMPEDPVQHDMAAAMLYSADLTRDVVGRYRRKLKRIQDRRRQREDDRKNMLEDTEEGDDGNLGRGGI